jgi:hypothetical protein
MTGLAEFAAQLARRIQREDFADFDQAARELFRLQYLSNPSFRKLCQAGNRGPQISDWREIPAVPTVASKELEMTSIPVGQRSVVFHSSGTTEQKPSRHFHHSESLVLYEASLRAAFRAHFLPDGAALRFVSLTPPKMAVPHSSLVYMIDAVGAPNCQFFGKTDQSGAWALDAEGLADALQQTREPVAVLGTAFLLLDFVDYLAACDVKLHLPPGSRVMETGGYKGRSRTIPKPELHARMSEYLGIPRDSIIGEYGMCELSSQAYDLRFGETDEPRGYRFPPWARALVISPENGRLVNEGEIGLIRVIDLANVWSVLAVQTEDLGIRRGDRFELIGRAAASEARGCSLMSA